eukprot:TRINITY_DN6919_c0_g1_i3.p1 TRINITY_DN6919_c0_g1~~TRINITY_DN6919_c0_g1_i3.p1  ORF type:complete len:924 (+),score=275.15 TRINITY_DN6919_c0_g1_i3:247-3018(+)
MDPSPRILPTWLSSLTEHERTVCFTVEDPQLVQLVMRLSAQELLQGQGLLQLHSRKRRKPAPRWVQLGEVQNPPAHAAQHLKASGDLLRSLCVGTSRRPYDTLVVRGELIQDVHALIECLNSLFTPSDCFRPAAHSHRSASVEWGTIGLLVAERLERALWERWKTAMESDTTGSRKQHPNAEFWSRAEQLKGWCQLQLGASSWSTVLQGAQFKVPSEQPPSHVVSEPAHEYLAQLLGPTIQPVDLALLQEASHELFEAHHIGEGSQLLMNRVVGRLLERDGLHKTLDLILLVPLTAAFTPVGILFATTHEQLRCTAATQAAAQLVADEERAALESSAKHVAAPHKLHGAAVLMMKRAARERRSAVQQWRTDVSARVQCVSRAALINGRLRVLQLKQAVSAWRTAPKLGEQAHETQLPTAESELNCTAPAVCDQWTSLRQKAMQSTAWRQGSAWRGLLVNVKGSDALAPARTHWRGLAGRVKEDESVRHKWQGVRTNMQQSPAPAPQTHWRGLASRVKADQSVRHKWHGVHQNLQQADQSAVRPSQAKPPEAAAVSWHCEEQMDWTSSHMWPPLHTEHRAACPEEGSALQLSQDLEGSALQLTQDLEWLGAQLCKRAAHSHPEHTCMIELVRAQAAVLAAQLWGGTAQVHLFGSRSVGLALAASDIDLVLVPSCALHEQQRQTALVKLGGLLQSSGGWLTGRVKSCQAVLSTSMPVLKVCMEHGWAQPNQMPQRVHVDISMQGSKPHAGLAAVQVVHELLQGMPPLKALVLVLKQLLVSNNLNHPYTGGLGSHALTLMVAAYVRTAREPSDSGSLLLGLLHYYAHQFNPAKQAVQIPAGACEPVLGAVPGSQSPAAVYVLDQFGSNVAACSFGFGAVQKLFGSTLAIINDNYTTGRPSHSTLIQIFTKKERHVSQPSCDLVRKP